MAFGSSREASVMSSITHHTDYRVALATIKQRIQAAQTRAVLAVNPELLGLY